MAITLETVQTLTPDQASYDAAKKLLKPAKWSAHGLSNDPTLIWAQCQGSGSNPYFVVVDIDDHGYKCTCPSRKFPCKHALALMLLYINDASQFIPNEIPTWVNDWLGRRRKSTKNDQNSENTTSKIIIDTPEDSKPALTTEELAKKQETQAKRAEKLKANTDAAIQAGLIELEQWLHDQLRMGLGALIDQAASKCRQISMRLNDAKASTLASRIDEIPANLANYKKEEQIHYLIQEFGQLVLLSQAWQINPDDPDARRAIASSENKEKLIESSESMRSIGIWQNIGEIIEVRKDGLISYATWLVQLSPNITHQQLFALLLDYHHLSAGKRLSGIGFGSYMVGELCFYPSRMPLRAFFTQQETRTTLTDDMMADAINAKYNTKHDTCLLPRLNQHYQAWIAKIPWAETVPFVLPSGRVVKIEQAYWWLTIEQKDAGEHEHWLPLSNDKIPVLVLGSELTTGYLLWNGLTGRLLSVVSSEWGLLSCQP